jgi:hypothetical protein
LAWQVSVLMQKANSGRESDEIGKLLVCAATGTRPRARLALRPLSAFLREGAHGHDYASECALQESSFNLLLAETRQ